MSSQFITENAGAIDIYPMHCGIKELFLEAIRIDPKCALAWSNLGGVLSEWNGMKTTQRGLLSLGDHSSTIFCGLLLQSRNTFTEETDSVKRFLGFGTSCSVLEEGY